MLDWSTNINNFITLDKFLPGKLGKEAQIFPKRLDFAKLHVLPNFLPQPANIFTRIYPQYP